MLIFNRAQQLFITD